ALTFQNHTNRPLTDFGGKTSIFSHPVYLFLREFSLQDSRGGSILFSDVQGFQTCRDIHFSGQFPDCRYTVSASDIRR
ncbi:hypothetical protein U9138_24955, partial [Escherichia coli]